MQQNVIVNASLTADAKPWTWVKDISGTAIGVGIMFYALGFLVRNAAFSMVWGIYDPEPFKSVSVETGILFSVFCCVACLPKILAKPKAKLAHTFLPFAICLVLSACVVAALWYYAENSGGKRDLGLWQWIWTQSQLVMSLVVCAVLSFFGGLLLVSAILLKGQRALRLGGKQAILLDPPLRTITAVLLMTVGLGILLFTFTFEVFVVCPQQWGGGKATKREIWFSNDAVPVLNAHHITFENENSENLVKLVRVANLWVLYERADIFIFCSNSYCDEQISIPGMWVESQIWSVRKTLPKSTPQ